MKKNKGFTLIELIAVMVVLAVILAVAVPSITGVIRAAKEKACILDANMMEKATKNYFGTEGITLKQGENKVVTLSTLQSKNYLSAVLDPEDRITSCEGYVVVTNANDVYTYKGALKCSDTCKTTGYDESLTDSTLDSGLDVIEKNGAKYFVGANPNNWVKFGRLDQSDNYGLLWRIIKIDNDGIKMVYEGRENNGTIPAEDGRVVLGSTAGVQWDASGINKWDTPASLKPGLDEWVKGIYVNKMDNYAIATYWQIGGIPYENPTDVSTFLQYQAIDSVNAGGSFKGLSSNKTIVGLSQAVDFISTSSNTACNSSYKESGSGNECALNADGSLNNFLYKNKYHWWTMNARSDTSNRTWVVNNTGQLGSSLTNSSIVSVRPVINIKKDVIYYAGDGSLENPFVLEDYMVGLSDKPHITMNGTTPTIIREGDVYIEEGATAVDEQDGDLTNKIVITSNVNVNVPGTYHVIYNVADSDGNAALPITREVIVSERDLPIIQLTGSNPMYVTINHNYVEEGATATDLYEGDISDQISITGTVNTSLLGVYYIKYNVTNSAGKKAIEVTRKVIVEPPKPVITLNGDSNVLVDIGDSYTELGATAWDEVDGNITDKIEKTIYIDNQEVSEVNGQARGNYIIKYQVTNSLGGSTTVYRNVSVVSVTGPNITFDPNGDDSPKKQNQTTVTVTANKHPVVDDSIKYIWVGSKWTLPYKTSLQDAINKPFKSGDKLTSPKGTDYFYLYAVAKDTYDDVTIKRSNYFKIDNYAPTIILKGSSIERLLIHDTYVEQGATATDKYYDGDLTSKIEITSNVNPNVEGIYSVIYKVSDTAGNEATATRKVIVYLPTPRIQLNGASDINVRVNTTYTELGATATDDIDGDITDDIVVSGIVDTTKAGLYKVTYSVTNSVGVTATRIRNITVYNPTPKITILGNNPYTSRILLPYADAGATAIDEIDGDLTNSIVTTGSVNPNVKGSYLITYSVTNSFGETATKTRTVNVTVPNPTITLNGDSYIEIYKNSIYSDAGATAIDEIDGNLTNSIVTEGTVNPSIEGTYTIKYTVTNSVGGISSATRTIKVKVSKPIITLNGNATITILKGTVYSDAGATAYDEIDGDLTNDIIVEGTVNPSVAGSYTITYSVTNSTGGSSRVNRSIIVNEPKLSLTLKGNNPFIMYIGDYFIDPGYTALDEKDGDISSLVAATTNLNPNVLGTYFVNYSVTSNSGVTKTTTRTIKVVQLDGPFISFSPNGDSTYTKNNITVVSVSDNKAPTNLSTLKYAWTTSVVKPTEDQITNSFTNGTSIATPPNVTGKYYLAVLAKDTMGNTSIVMSNAFNLDNIAPVINLIGSNIIETPVDSVYVEPGVNVVEADSGLDSNGVRVDSTIVPGVLGSYKVTYNATDKAGNIATAITRTVVVREVSLSEQIGDSETYIPKYYADYFIGSDPHNWIEFGQLSQYDSNPYLWRIVKSDDTGIKLVFEGLEREDNSLPLENGRISLDGELNSPYDSNNSNKWNSPVSISAKLQTWFDGVYEPDKNTLLVPINWCVGGINSPYTIDNFKTGECLTQTTAGGTFNGSSSSKISIALLNSSDYLLASASTCSAFDQVSCGSNNYLAKDYSYLTINADASSANNIFATSSMGGLTIASSNTPLSVRPVINLRVDALVLSGEGTLELPYRLNNRIPVIDNEGPIITFNPNSGSTYKQKYDVEVIATDTGTGVKDDSLKYVWTTSSTQPAQSSITNSFVNGTKVSSPSASNGTYYLWVTASDNKGNSSIMGSGAFKLDSSVPVITLNGSSTITIERGSVYSDLGATATDGIDGPVAVTSVSNVNSNALGSYTVTYTAKDTSGNIATATRTVIVADTTLPTVTFGTNGTASYVKSINTLVTVSDNDAVNNSSLKYQWTTSATAPSEASFVTAFTNGTEISTPASVSGSYYLWVLAKDATGNKIITKSNIFKLDNVAPVITLTGSAVVKILLNEVYADAGATATDNMDGNITTRIVVTSDVNSSLVGTYNVTYTVSDTAGNLATPKSRQVIVYDAQYLVDVVNVENYVNYTTSLTYTGGWLVYSKTGSGSTGIVTLVSAGSVTTYGACQGDTATFAQNINNVSHQYLNSTYASNSTGLTLGNITGLSTSSPLRTTGSYYWLASVYSTYSYYYVDGAGNYARGSSCSLTYGVRPLVSLKAKIIKTGGTGTKTDPFQIDILN